MTNNKEVVVSENKKGVYVRDISIGNHVVVADEPSEVGGNDLGPSPYELLLASLGTCTSITTRMYANYKKIPLDNIIVKLKHEKVHADDCKNCENDNSKIDRISLSLTLEGNLSQEQRDRLLEIAKKCPVHRTLTSSVQIISKLD